MRKEIAPCRVAVVGAGSAGCATAIALAGLGVTDVILIDGSPRTQRNVGETLSPDARGVLQQLRLWDGFVSDRHEPCLGSCSAWGSPSLGYSDFMLTALGSGWHIDRGRLDAFLLKRALDVGVHHRTARVVDAIEADPLLRLTLRDETGRIEKVDAEYVVDASGASSAIAKRLSVRRSVVDKMTFICAHLRRVSNLPASRLTLVEAVREGWWYTADLPEQRVIVALATEAEIAKTLIRGEPAKWLDLLSRTKHLARRLDGCVLDTPEFTVRAVSSFLLASPSGARWLAVGDAAAVYDPISSIGIEKALSNAVDAAQTIAGALSNASAIPPDYRERISRAFEQYRSNRDYFYAIEQRWPDALFWRNRHRRNAAAA